MAYNTIHNTVVTCFNPSSLPLISDAWISTTVLDEEITLKNKTGQAISTNSLMIELKVDGYIVIDGHAYPVFADSPLTISLCEIKKFQVIGAIDSKLRWIAMTY